jgi:hypothetical protein
MEAYYSVVRRMRLKDRVGRANFHDERRSVPNVVLEVEIAGFSPGELLKGESHYNGSMNTRLHTS